MMNHDRLKSKPFYLDQEAIRWVEQTLKNMTLAEKAGHLFCISPPLDDDQLLTDQLMLHPCGLMLRPNDTDVCIGAVNKINERSKYPMLIAADLEKGGNGASNSGTTIGSPLGIAATDNPEYAWKLGAICAKEGAAVGVNWLFGPITDIDINPFNPITNVRTFGSSQARVKAMSLAYIDAAQSAGTAASAKHFPGDGVDFRDQHIVSTTNSLSAEEWDKSYGDIYCACIDAGVKTIMIGHIYQPAWARKLNPDITDAEMMPASLSGELVQGLLRDHLQFNGVAVTDATTMTGFMQALPRESLIPQVIKAGVDVILFTLNFKADVGYIMDAVQNGSLSMERVDEAVTRTLALKASLNLHKRLPNPIVAEAEKVIGCQTHIDWAHACADDSITLVKEEYGVLPLSPDRHRRLLYIPLEGKPDEFAHNRIRSGAALKMADMLKKEGFDLTVLEAGTEVFKNIRIYEYMKANFDAILYCANYGATSNQTTVRIQWPANNMGWCPNFTHSIPTVFVSLENPYHLLDMPRVKTYINAYSPTDVTMQAVVDKLMGRSAFKGINPVDPFCGLWDARL